MCSSGTLAPTPTRLYGQYHNPGKVTVLRIIALICGTLSRTQDRDWQKGRVREEFPVKGLTAYEPSNICY
jgi:hypothetical protein